MSDVRPRIIGTEMEWPIRIQTTPNTQFKQATQEQALNAMGYLDDDIYSTEVGGMLSNGGRFYLDIGDHPEYATPECASLDDIVTAEIAGERIMENALRRAREEGEFHDYKLNKRVVDDRDSTWGYHASFCCDASRLEIDSEHLSLLGLHLATQNIYAGAGAVRVHEGTGYYVLAQKVLNFNEDFHHQSYDGFNPVISLRDEPLADRELYKRVHVTSMDANTSPWATKMRLGTTSIVLRMIEDGYRGRQLMTRTPLHHVAVNVAHDISLTRRYELQDSGKRLRAVDIQEKLCEYALVLASEGKLSDEEENILPEWQYAINVLRSDPRKLIDRSDWVAKKAALERIMGRHGLMLSSDEVVKKDRFWDEIGPTAGIGLTLRETAWNKWMPAESDIHRLTYQPPYGTRAHVRGGLIHQHVDDPSFGASWGSVVVPKGNQTTLTHHLDPYQTTI